MVKVIITGGLGFIGSNFILKLLSLKNFMVLNIDNLSYSSNIDVNKLFKKYPNYIHKKNSIGDPALRSVIKKFCPDYIINFAAESHVDKSIDGPLFFFQNNVNDLVSFIENIRKSNTSVKKFIHISTDEVYGDLKITDKSFTEDSPLSPNSPYASSKACGDNIIRSWHKTYGMPMIITHCTNNYGPNQFPEKLIPLVINKALRKERIPIYGAGKNIRDWIHVSDHNNAVIKVMRKGIVGNIYNISAKCELSNIDIVKKICNILTYYHKDFNYFDLIEYVNDRPSHDFRYSLENKKIVKELGWKPLIKFEKGIKDTVKWYVDNQKWVEKIIRKNSNILHRQGLKI